MRPAARRPGAASTSATTPSASPSAAARSSAPTTSTTATSTPRAAKYERVSVGWRVAMRRRPSRSARAAAPRRGGVDEQRATKAQVEQLAEPGGALEQHVLGHETGVGDAVCEVGRHVVGGDHHDPRLEAG